MSQNQKRKRRCCNGKIRHESLAEAKAAILQMTSRKAKQGNPVVSFMRAYGCACGGFHIGNTKNIDWDMVAALTSRHPAKEVQS